MINQDQEVMNGEGYAWLTVKNDLELKIIREEYYG